jgi:hypothetical protein
VHRVAVGGETESAMPVIAITLKFFSENSSLCHHDLVIIDLTDNGAVVLRPFDVDITSHEVSD